MMKKSVAAACIVVAVSSSTFAQTAAAPTARDRQQAKVDGMLKEYLAANDAVEARIDEAVATLTSLRDSPESGTKVADTQMDAIESLKAGVDEFRLQRLKIEENLRRSTSSWDPETLKKVEAFLDGKIQDRSDKIMALANSVVSGSGAVESRTVLRDDGWGNLSEVEDTTSKEAKQDKKLGKRADEVQKETREVLEKRITDIENQVRTLKTQAASAGDPERKAELERQAAEYEARLASAREALSSVGESSYEGGTRTIESSSEGHKLNMKLRELTAQLQVEQRKVDMMGAQLMNELAKLDSMKAAGNP